MAPVDLPPDPGQSGGTLGTLPAGAAGVPSFATAPFGDPIDRFPHYDGPTMRSIALVLVLVATLAAAVAGCADASRPSSLPPSGAVPSASTTPTPP